MEGGGGSWMLRAGGDWSPPPLLPTALPVGEDKPLPPPPLPPPSNVFFSFILLNIFSFSFPIGPGVEAVGAGNRTRRGFFKTEVPLLNIKCLNFFLAIRVSE